MEFILNNLAVILFIIIIALISFLYKKLKALVDMTYANKNSILVLSKDLFITKYFYYKRQNNISVLEKETVNNLYQEYKKLGGNSIVDNLKEEFDKIPINDENIFGG